MENKLTNTNEFFVNKLSGLMKAKKYSQKTLAQKIGTQQSTVNAWVSGRVMPSISNLEKLCTLFNTNPNELLGYNASAPVGYMSKDEVLKIKKEYEKEFDRLKRISAHNEDENLRGVKVIDKVRNFCNEGIDYAEKSMKKFNFIKKNRENNEMWQAIKDAYAQVLKITEGEE